MHTHTLSPPGAPVQHIPEDIVVYLKRVILCAVGKYPFHSDGPILRYNVDHNTGLQSMKGHRDLNKSKDSQSVELLFKSFCQRFTVSHSESSRSRHALLLILRQQIPTRLCSRGYLHSPLSSHCSLSISDEEGAAMTATTRLDAVSAEIAQAV